MDYEQKYKEILEWARKNKARLNGVPIEDVLPELAESEDEKVRKAIIGLIEELQRSDKYFAGVELTDMIAYLEKQKEQPEEPKIAFGDWGDKEKKEAIITCLQYMRFVKKITNQEYDDLVKWLEDNLKEQKSTSYSPLCNTIKDKIREYVANHFVTDTIVKTDVKSIVKAMEEGVRLGKEEQKEQKPADLSEMMVHKEPYIAPVPIPMVADEQFPPLEGLDAIKAKYYDDGFKNGFDEGVESVKPAEWSEEDEEIWNHIIDCAESRAWIPFNEISWLVAHKPQFYWKPSEEQMEELQSAITFMAIHNMKVDSLVSLHKELKKL